MKILSQGFGANRYQAEGIKILVWISLYQSALLQELFYSSAVIIYFKRMYTETKFCTFSVKSKGTTHKKSKRAEIWPCQNHFCMLITNLRVKHWFCMPPCCKPPVSISFTYCPSHNLHGSSKLYSKQRFKYYTVCGLLSPKQACGRINLIPKGAQCSCLQGRISR